jgi:hypothetical protein
MVPVIRASHTRAKRAVRTTFLSSHGRVPWRKAVSRGEISAPSFQESRGLGPESEQLSWNRAGIRRCGGFLMALTQLTA